MKPAAPDPVVLVGGGHAHLHVANEAARFREVGIDLVLVDPDDFWYSGIATGIVGGQYPVPEGRVDLARLARRAGFTYRVDRAVGLDPERRILVLERGGEIRYSAVSFNVGSAVDTRGIDGAEAAVGAKPIRELLWLPELLADIDSPLVVAGGGATGCELAANLACRLETEEPAGRGVLLIGADERLLPGAPGGAGRRLARWLGERGVRIRTGTRITRIVPFGGGRGGSCTVELTSGETIAAAEVVLATGLRPPDLIARLGLPLGPDGGLAVERTLAARGHHGIFGAGDCIDFLPRPLPRLGVYAVKEARVLVRNLLASLAGEALEPYRPQTRALSILNLGRGVGLALWGPFWWLGKLSMLWKDRLDRGFLDRYRG